MALDRFVSPGVFTRENDQSFLPQGIAEIGAAFIGPTVKGPAFVPTIVESPEEFIKWFGNAVPDFYVGHAAIDYLGDAARGTIVRVLGIGGYDIDPIDGASGVVISVSSSQGTLPLALIWPSTNVSASLGSATDNRITTASLTYTSGDDFDLVMSSSDGKITNLTGLSLNPTSTNYYVSALGESPNTAEAGYVLLHWPSASLSSSAGVADWTGDVTNLTADSGTEAGSAWDFRTSDYREAETPWMQSQTLGGVKHDLFKVHTFADGTAANRSIKVSITSIRPANEQLADLHGKFSVIVREYSDTDNRVSILEQHDNVSLDPTSVDYIGRRIGDQHWAFDANNELVQLGDYPNYSDYIYVEMSNNIDSIPVRALPYGYGAPYFPLYTGLLTGVDGVSSPAAVLTRYQLPISGTSTIENTKVYYGWDYTDQSSISYLSEVSENAGVNTAVTFSLEDVNDADIPLAITNNTAAGSTVRKFTPPLQRGSDGLNPSRVIATAGNILAENTQGFDLTLQQSSGTVAYIRAIDAVSDPEAYDINLLSVPGVLHQLHQYVTSYATIMCENRGDCFYLMDGFSFGSTVDSAVNLVAGTDTNYAAVYHPWVKIFDEVTARLIWVPPSVAMPGVYAFNDKVAAEWFAPAGLNRGGIDIAVQVEKRLTRQNRDDLYEARINPIALFPGQGVVAFGQKTLQVKPSALDRVNVRRLLITVKKFIASAARYLVFEQNVEATRQRFLNIANPYLASVQERSGLYAFKVIMDDSNNTPDLIDRNILVGQIYLQPTRVAEFISLEFNILPTGATFPSGA